MRDQKLIFFNFQSFRTAVNASLHFLQISLTDSFRGRYDSPLHHGAVINSYFNGLFIGLFIKFFKIDQFQEIISVTYKNFEKIIINMMLLQLPTMIEGLDVEPIQPLLDVIEPFFLKLSIIGGGIIGLYIIFILMRVYYERKTINLLKDIRYDLDQLNHHHGLRTSHLRKGTVGKAFHAVKRLFKR